MRFGPLPTKMPAQTPIPNPELRRFLLTLRELQKIDPEFPLQYALCLGLIAENEGGSLSDLAEKANYSLSTTSRIVGALSHKRQKGQAYNLVKVKICPNERRRKEISLTPKGRAIISALQNLLSEQSAPNNH